MELEVRAKELTFIIKIVNLLRLLLVFKKMIQLLLLVQLEKELGLRVII